MPEPAAGRQIFRIAFFLFAEGTGRELICNSSIHSLLQGDGTVKNKAADKYVDALAEVSSDRGSIPLASTKKSLLRKRHKAVEEAAL